MVDFKVVDMNKTATRVAQVSKVRDEQSGREYVVIQQPDASVPEHMRCRITMTGHERQDQGGSEYGHFAEAVPSAEDEDGDEEVEGEGGGQQDKEDEMTLWVRQHGVKTARIVVTPSAFVNDAMERKKMVAAMRRAAVSKHPLLAADGVLGRVALPIPLPVTQAESRAADAAFLSAGGASSRPAAEAAPGSATAATVATGDKLKGAAKATRSCSRAWTSRWMMQIVAVIVVIVIVVVVLLGLKARALRAVVSRLLNARNLRGLVS